MLTGGTDEDEDEIPNIPKSKTVEVKSDGQELKKKDELIDRLLCEIERLKKNKKGE